MDQTATGPDRIAVELAADLDAGFAALFEAHQNVLFSIALRICGRWADAEDLTAAAFLRAAAATIPRSETRPYGWIARQAGRPRAVRAAASALAANPVPLLIPCHRIVQADGVAGGYVFGTPRKEALLRLEGANLDEVRDLAAAGTRYLASDTTGVVCFPSCRNARRITRSPWSRPPSRRAGSRAGSARSCPRGAVPPRPRPRPRPSEPRPGCAADTDGQLTRTMIVNSLRCYVPRTVHDHETGAAGLA